MIVTNPTASITSNPATLEVSIPNDLSGFNTGLLAHYPFNGNVFLDISNFAGSDVIFRIQSTILIW